MLKIVRKHWIGQAISIFIFFSIGVIFVHFVYPVIGKLYLSIEGIENLYLTCIQLVLYFLFIQSLNYIGIKTLSKTLGKINIEIQNYLFHKTQNIPIDKFNHDGEGKFSSQIPLIANSVTSFLEILYIFIVPFATEIIITLYKLYNTTRFSFYIFFLWIFGYVILNILIGKLTAPRNQALFKSRGNTLNFISDIFKNIFLEKIYALQEKNHNSLQEYLKEDQKNYSNSLTTIGLSRFVVGMYNIICLVLFIIFLVKSQINSKLIVGFTAMGLSMLTNLWKTLNLNTQLFLLYGQFSNVKYIENQTSSSGHINLESIDSIKISNLNYKYENDLILKDINIEALKGTSIKVNGYSGSGKSTFIKCCTRLLNLPRGIISYNNIDINDISEETLRSKISFLTQGDFIFNNTLRHNLCSDKPDAELIKLCNSFNLNIPLDYVLGSNNSKISGGQAKRIAFIRLLLHLKPGNLIFLDEPFENLDTDNIRLITQTIRKLKEKHIIFCVDHSNFFTPDIIIDLPG